MKCDLLGMYYSRAIHDVLIEVAQRDPSGSDALITYKQLAQRVNLPLEHEGPKSIFPIRIKLIFRGLKKKGAGSVA